MAKNVLNGFSFLRQWLSNVRQTTADTFNNYFTNIAQAIVSYIENESTKVFSYYLNKQINSPFKINNVDEEAVKKIIYNLTTKHYCGLYNLTTKHYCGFDSISSKYLKNNSTCNHKIVDYGNKSSAKYGPFYPVIFVL